jgi:transcriptional regulator with XRE-family HTH domain
MPTQPSLQQLAKALGTRIRQLRKKKGLAQGEFALICGLHRSHMGKIERGETNVRLSTLLVIAQNLETTVEKLLSESYH